MIMNFESFNQYDITREDIKNKFPKEISIYTTNGSFKLKLGDFTREVDIIRASYSHSTPEEMGGNVVADGEPDSVSFDIHFTKTNEGKRKILIDISYGDDMHTEFALTQPNKVKLIHYNGYDSRFDGETHFGFQDNCLKELVKLFNSFDKNFKFSVNDFKFIDKYPNTFKYNESIKITPLSKGEVILLIDNSKAPKRDYINNIIRYLRIRGIATKVVRTIEEMDKDWNVVGIISSGSEYRVEDDQAKVSKKAIDRYNVPYLGICYGAQALCRFYGGKIMRSKKHTHDNLKLDKWVDNKLFKGIDMKDQQFSFSFWDYPSKEPRGFKVLAKSNDKIVAFGDDYWEKYGVLFHPEDLEETWKILDNFISICHNGQSEQDKIKGI